MKRIITLVLAVVVVVSVVVAAPSKKENRDEVYKYLVKNFTMTVYAEPDIETICMAYALINAFPERMFVSKVDDKKTPEEWKEFTKLTGWTKDEYIQESMDLLKSIYLERIKEELGPYLNELS